MFLTLSGCALEVLTVDPEYGMPARDLHVSIFEVNRVVTGGRLLLTELGWGQVGYSGDG